MAARVTRKVPLHESIYKLNEKLNMLMGEMKKLRNVVLQGLDLGQRQGQGQQGPLEQQQEEVELQATEESPVEPVLARGPGRRSDWHYWAANWAAKNPDVPRDETFSLKMAEAYRAWKDAHPGQSYLDFRGSDVIDGRKRFTQKKGKKVAPAPAPFREPTPPPAPAPFREPTPPPAPLREPTPPTALAPFREPTPPPAPFREPTPPPAPSVARQETPNKYSPPSAGPLSTPSLLQGRRETPPQEYYDLAEEEQEIPEESVEESVPEQQEELSAAEEAEEASSEWPQEEEQAELEIVTVGQQEYFRTSNNGLFAVVRDEEGNPEPGSWAGVLSDDGTQVLEVDQPEAP
jgi:hypothetical protein